MKIAIAGDHAGYGMKEEVIKYLIAEGHEVKDFGAFSSESSDYPDYAHPMAAAIEKGDYELGVSLCGSGNGINIAANKHQGIRSAICWTNEIAQLARSHNNANICALPARFVTKEEALTIIHTFLTTKFEGGRHQRRIDKIPINK